MKNIMKTNILCVDINNDVKSVAENMKRKKSSYAILVNKNRAEGIITRSDIVYKLVAEGKDYNTKAKDIMSAPLIVIFPETEIEEIIEIFKQHDVKRLIVIDKIDGKLLGVVEKDDVFKIISDSNK